MKGDEDKGPAELEGAILALLSERGPLTGKELQESTGADVLKLWRACRLSSAIRETQVGERYLRLDKVVKDYARLSPSIKREFLTYRLLNDSDQAPDAADRALLMREEFRQISKSKFDLALERVLLVVESLPFRDEVLDKVCFIIAGDVVFGMAHREPRPESSLGKIVNGSDLDVIVVTTDDFPDALKQELDEAIYAEKYRLLVNPLYREEIDYIIKNMSRVGEQLAFDTFKHMVACKILDEGEFLLGSRALFEEIKRKVANSGVDGKLREMEARAASFRESAERELLSTSGDLSEQECWKLFYTQAEQDEIF